MSAALKIVLVLTALAGAPVGYVFYNATLSPDAWRYGGALPSNWTDIGAYHAAPGPIAGVGLPFLGLSGGAYWLFRRTREPERLWPVFFLAFALIYNATEAFLLKQNNVFWILYCITTCQLYMAAPRATTAVVPTSFAPPGRLQEAA